MEESIDLLEFSKDGDATAPLGRQSITTLVEKCPPLGRAAEALFLLALPGELGVAL